MDANEGVEFLDFAFEAENINRDEAREDLKFGFGDQWPDYSSQTRGLERPELTINELDAYIRQVCNTQRQQRPRGKAHPVDSLSDPKTAEVITGLGRHIELMSDADYAYDTAFEYAVRMGWGYIRLKTDYIREDRFEQDIFIDTVVNPFSVYFDPMSELPDGSDAEKALVTDMILKTQFEKDYPGAQSSGFTELGNSGVVWETKECTRIAEYFSIDKKKSTLIMLSDKTVLWKDELPKNIDILALAGISIIGERESYKRVVNWQKQTNSEVLDSKVWAGRWIPIIPVYGGRLHVDGRMQKFGLIRFAKDPQRMINFWQTSVTESIALAPKAKWLMSEGQDEGHENDWAKANISPKALLKYRQVDLEGRPAPPPQRIQPEMPPAGAIQLAMASTENLRRVLGMFDPAIRTSKGVKSDETINAEQQQSDQSTFHFSDNLIRSIKFVWRQIVDLTPKIFDSERISRIIGDDGRPKIVTINQSTIKDGIATVLNDVTVGQYDSVMDVGPGYNSRRQEFVANLTEMSKGKAGEQLWQVAGDLLFRNMDFPGADIIADRLAANNPLAQIDEKSDIPPAVQMKLKQSQQMIQQLQQQLQSAAQEIKVRTGIVQMQEDGETKRELMRLTSKAHDVENATATKRHDVEARAVTAQNVAEINGIVQLLVKHLDTKMLEKEIESRNKEQQIKHAEDEIA